MAKDRVAWYAAVHGVTRNQTWLSNWTTRTICKIIKLESFWTSYTKINSKWVNYLNFRPETIKLLEENIGRTLYDINHSKIFYDPPPRAMEIKTKMKKWDLIKLKSFWTVKKIISRVKSQPSEWEKKKIAMKQLTKKYYSPKYTNSPCSSMLEKRTTQSKGGQKI